MFTNPFFLYSLTWLGVLLLYNFKISNLYPNISNKLLFFILFSAFISFLLSIFYSIKLKKYNNFKIIKGRYLSNYVFIYLLFIIEFIYEGKIPLIETLLKTGYMYKDFNGIKTLHVIIFTYNFYINLCCFNDFQYTKQKKYLFYNVLGIVPYILLYTRGPILMLIVCEFFIWLSYKYKLKTIIKIGILGIVILYIFGILGNLRHYYNWNDTRMIKNIAQINTKKNILDPLIWGYVYITSPLGNLQNSLNETKPNYNIKSFVCENLLLDAVSKRLNYEKNSSKLMVENLTVSTAYVNSYLSCGIYGMNIIFFIYMFCEIIYIFILRKTKYRIIGVSLIIVLNIFSIFDNMFIYSGLSFCLIYPLIDVFKKKIKNIRRRNKI